MPTQASEPEVLAKLLPGGKNVPFWCFRSTRASRDWSRQLSNWTPTRRRWRQSSSRSKNGAANNLLFANCGLFKNQWNECSSDFFPVFLRLNLNSETLLCRSILGFPKALMFQLGSVVRWQNLCWMKNVSLSLIQPVFQLLKMQQAIIREQ